MATDAAHRLPRSGGGLWCPSNLVAMCRVCHGWCHANPTLAKAGGWIVASGVTSPADVPVWLAPALAWPAWWRLDPDGVYVAADVDRPTPVLPGVGR